MWRKQLKELEEERRETEQRIEGARSKTRAEDLLTRVNVISHNEKLYQISMKRPDLWRAMKAKEVAQVQLEEREEHTHELNMAGVEGHLQGGDPLQGTSEQAKGIELAQRRDYVAHSSILNAVPVSSGNMQFGAGSAYNLLKSNKKG